MPDSKPTYFYPIDLLRFVSASMVMWFHLSFYDWASTFSTGSRALGGAADFPWSTPTAWFGWVGVEIFFVISGFVIAGATRQATALTFVKNRLLRLMPAAWICATITLAARLLMLHEPIGDLVKPYLHSMVLWPEGAWIDGVYWSLAVELSFYAIVFAMLLARASRLLPLLAWGLSFLTAGYLLLGAGHAGTASGGWWMVNQHAELLLLRHGAFFAAGIWLYRSSQGQLTLAGWAGLVLALGVGGSEIWIKAGEVMSAEAHAALGQPRLAPLLVWSAAMVGLFAFSRWPKAFTPRSTRVQSVFKRIGGATYPLYLVHQIVGVALLRLLVERGLAPPIALACAIAAMLALAFALSIHAEPAVRGVLRGRLDQLELTLAGLAARLRHGRP